MSLFNSINDYRKLLRKGLITTDDTNDVIDLDSLDSDPNIFYYTSEGLKRRSDYKNEIITDAEKFAYHEARICKKLEDLRYHPIYDNSVDEDYIVIPFSGHVVATPTAENMIDYAKVVYKKFSMGTYKLFITSIFTKAIFGVIFFFELINLIFLI